MSPVGTKRTSRAGLTMSVVQGCFFRQPAARSEDRGATGTADVRDEYATLRQTSSSVRYRASFWEQIPDDRDHSDQRAWWCVCHGPSVPNC